MTDQNEAIRDERADDDAAAAPEDGRDWREAYLREVAQSRRYRQRAQQAEARALDEAQGAEYERLVQAAKQLEAKTQRIAALESVVKQVAGLGELTRALAACGVGSGCPHGQRMLDQASSLLAGRISVDVSGEAPRVRVLDDSGRPAVDQADRPLTVSQFVASWLAEEGSHFLPASGDTGSGAHRGRATGAGVSIEQLDRDPKAKAKYIAKHGPQAYVQLARTQR
ncbi:MAG: hypothetical protein ISS78_05435 [Phycisphaerae bacterium]|nr:hypothetical protein [Phycisphaerae bacterium]